MTNAKSVAAARQLGDIFSHLQWHRYGLFVSPLNSPTMVAIQYKSRQCGCCRVVTCDALALLRWLNLYATKPAAWSRFLSILDKKTEHRTPVQQELLPPAAWSPAAKRSMIP